MDKKDNREPLLSVKNLVVEYSSEKKIVHAVNDVSFSVDRGRTLGLVGETGAGKTSIAKAILQVLPEISAFVRGGEILFDGKNLLELSDRKMAQLRGKRISMIFQDPMTALNPVIRVGNQIAEALVLHEHIGRNEAKEQAEKMLEMVGIRPERYGDFPHQFSGGMKQRVVIAMALACRPELLIADEPTTALDVTIQAQVLDMIRELRDTLQTALIMITHDLGVVAEICDEVAVVYAGEIVEYGTLEEIFDHPTHPYTIGLFGALPDVNRKLHRLAAINGMPPDPTDLPRGCKFSPRCPYADEACRQKKPEMEEMGGTHVCRCIHIREEERHGKIN